MEEIQTPEIKEYHPKNINNEINAKKNANAFLQMADEISNGEVFPESDEQEPKVDQVPKTPKPKKNTMNIGPKYLEALDHVTQVADIRSIEVHLPILGKKVEVKPLTGKEEQVLRTAAVSPESFLQKMDEIIYNHTVFKETQHQTYNEFLSALYPPDKSMILWALMSASYLVLPSMEKTCEVCNENYVVDSSPDELIHSDTLKGGWDKKLMPNEFSISTKVLGGYLTIETGLPSELNRLNISKGLTPETAKDNLNKRGNIMSYVDNLVFFTRSLTIGDGDDEIILDDIFQDVYPFLKNIPPKVIDAIKNEVDLEYFDKYMPYFYIKATCSHCGAVEKISVDPELAFFRKTLSL